MISQSEYLKLLSMIEDMAVAREADKEKIEHLEGSVAYMRDQLENDYVPKEKYQEELMLLREQQSFIAEEIGNLTGLAPAEVLNASALGKRMNIIETDHRKVERLLEDMNGLMGDVVMEIRNGPNPFMPNKPSALERLAQKKGDAIRVMK